MSLKATKGLAPLVISLLFSIALSTNLGAQESAGLRVFGLKGPSGVSMAPLIVTPPVLEGVTAVVDTLPSADLMVAKILSGEVDVGILPPNVAAKLAAVGKGIKVAAVVGEGMLRFLTADPAISSLADLAGKDVYVAGQGATPEFVFRTILEARGMSSDKDLSLRFSMAYPEMAQALIAGRISSAILPEPFATMAVMGKPGLRSPFDIQTLWASVTGGGNYPMTVIFVSDQASRERHDEVAELLRVWQSAVSWTVSNPRDAGLLAQKADLGLKAPIVSAAIPTSAYVFRSARAARGDLEALFSVFLKESPASIGGRMPADSFYWE